MKPPIHIYDARKNKRGAKLSQNTTLNSENGLDLLDGLLCYSPSWFEAIEEGRIPVEKAQGKITRVYVSGHNDYPEFELSEAGNISNWTRYGTETYLRKALYDRFYKVGNTVRITYVLHPWKPDPDNRWLNDGPAKIVLTVEIWNEEIT